MLLNVEQNLILQVFFNSNLFEENLIELVNNGDCVGFIYDIEDFEKYFPDYKLEIVEKE